MVNIDQVKKLREMTGLSITECKKALEKTGDDIDKAKETLRKWGKSFVIEKAGRQTGHGVIETYVHPNRKVGVILELRCETDFVARSKDFQNLAHELCLQIAAMNPQFLKTEDIPEEFLKKEKQIYREQIEDSKKPQNVIDQIVKGKLDKTIKSISLKSQSWIRDESKTVEDMINEYISKLGENILINRFSRYEI